MAIRPAHLTIRFLFEQNHSFVVPKYQRGYAWDFDAVDDFIEDLTRCLTARENNTARNHFFGGVVTVQIPVLGSIRSNYEVIDGQQRLASFVMLTAAIVLRTQNIINELDGTVPLEPEERKARDFLVTTIDTLRNPYLQYRDEIGLQYVDIPKLTLSVADNDFFQAIISGQQASPKRASHNRIKAAWHRLTRFINGEVLNCGTTWENAKRLQLLVNSVLAADCSVIFMCAETKTEAYQIFQVLNDRGVHLTDGDLLRANTMELLDASTVSAIQDRLAAEWDKVLSYPPNDIDNYLRWYLSSWEGRRPKSSNLTGQFLDLRFHNTPTTDLSSVEPRAILTEVQQLNHDFAALDTLGDGDWPYTHDSVVTAWDRERLRILVRDLKHTNAMPLLLALRTLDEKTFAAAVAAVERFVFRFKIIGNAHIAPVTELYLRHAVKIRNTGSYKIRELRADLKALVEKAVPDSIFEANLRQVRYLTRSGNGQIRYMLIALEDYGKWYDQGAQGVPKCKDKTRVSDFVATTIEHIYPRSAEETNRIQAVEEIKHMIGNLTIFGPGDNRIAGNKPYLAKRKDLKRSNFKLNRDIAENNDWTAGAVEARTETLIKMALKIFVP